MKKCESCDNSSMGYAESSMHYSLRCNEYDKCCDEILDCRNYFNSSEKIKTLEAENSVLKECIENKYNIVKAYDEYKNSNLKTMIEGDEKLSQEFDDVFNSYKINRDKEINALSKENKKLRECVSFYAKENNWLGKYEGNTPNEYIVWKMIVEDDCDALRLGGKLARQTLKELEA